MGTPRRPQSDEVLSPCREAHLLPSEGPCLVLGSSQLSGPKEETLILFPGAPTCWSDVSAQILGRG